MYDVCTGHPPANEEGRINRIINMTLLECLINVCGKYKTRYIYTFMCSL